MIQMCNHMLAICKPKSPMCGRDYPITACFLDMCIIPLLYIGYRENCGDKMDNFLQHCFYHSGQYDSEDCFKQLSKKLEEHEVDFAVLLIKFVLCKSSGC
jgi:hypothetical protein